MQKPAAQGGWVSFGEAHLSADYDFDPTADYVAEVTPDPYLIGSPGSTMGWAAAEFWPANKIPDEYRTVQPSSVETLMLSGTLDVSTPAQNARNQLLPLLENGEQVVLAEFAHTGDLYYLQPEATRNLLAVASPGSACDSGTRVLRTMTYAATQL